MLEEIAAALFIHLGKKAIDTFWSDRSSDQYPIVDPTGNISYTTLNGSRTVVRQSAIRSRIKGVG